MKKIFLNQPCFGKEEINAAYQSLKNLRLSQGIKVSEFENSFSSYIGCKYGIATNSGSSANLIALAALKEYYKIDFNVPLDTEIKIGYNWLDMEEIKIA